MFRKLGISISNELRMMPHTFQCYNSCSRKRTIIVIYCGKTRKIYIYQYRIYYYLLLIVNEHDVSLAFPARAKQPITNDCNDGRSIILCYTIFLLPSITDLEYSENEYPPNSIVFRLGRSIIQLFIYLLPRISNELQQKL